MCCRFAIMHGEPGHGSSRAQAAAARSELSRIVASRAACKGRPMQSAHQHPHDDASCRPAEVQLGGNPAGDAHAYSPAAHLAWLANRHGQPDKAWYPDKQVSSKR